MSSDLENFGQLRRLLALKRHEQPPPGYFDRLSGDIRARIRSGDTGQASAMERLFDEAPWLQRVLSVFEARPAFAGVCGMGVCALLISGIIFSERMEIDPVSPGPIAADVSPFAALTPVAMSQTGDSQDILSSNGPMTTPLHSLFDQLELNVQPASASGFFPAGN